MQNIHGTVNFSLLIPPRDEQILFPFAIFQQQPWGFAEEQRLQPAHIGFWKQIANCELLGRLFWQLAQERF